MLTWMATSRANLLPRSLHDMPRATHPGPAALRNANGVIRHQEDMAVVVFSVSQSGLGLDQVARRPLDVLRLN